MSLIGKNSAGNVRGIGLLSGGLDSMLSAMVLMDQGIEVIGLTFQTPFFGSAKGEYAARSLGIRHVILDITDEHLVMVKNPSHGYGKNMNPCIDCHAMMFSKAGGLLEKMGADFLFSGEILGQRPMSQNAGALAIVESTSGCEGLILRPMSARLLPETDVEKAGLVDRSRLLDIQGRSRKRQMEMARAFGIHEFPSPAGGCLLTDPGFSLRLKDLFDHNPDATPLDVKRLKVGRHFRMPGGSKVIIGRHHADNEELESLFSSGDYDLRVDDIPGPITLVEGTALPDEIILAASFTVRYSKAVELGHAPVRVKAPDGTEKILDSSAAEGDLIERFRIA
ncbi:MAG: tRNA 4-thiouridine(8) synthase ThiI [Deltaproteobacteria bacterium]|nr:tRNA 4-thiouridine(8) synthase ThiI [Deltaproteobacteria bacterium]